MKKKLTAGFNPALAAALALGGMYASAPSAMAENVEVQVVLVAYTDGTVLKTYEKLSSEAVKLDKDVESLAKDPTDANVTAAATQWKQVRSAWEQGESFLFGPAAFTNLDPKLDSWPLDQVQLDNVLSNIDAGKLDVSPGYVRDYLGAALRGFHAVEYLLFRDGQPRKAKDFTPGQLAYLAAATRVLAEDAIALEGWWAGADALAPEKKAYLEAAEIEVSGAYAKEFKNAGKAGSRYGEQAEAVDEILQGCVDIASELAESKLGGPAKSADPKDCESWYSLTSLEDCRNNILSIRNAYVGMSGAPSISSLVAAKDKALDAQTRAAIEQALSQIAAIPSPLSKNLDKKEALNAAIASCEQLSQALEKAQKTLAN